MDKEVVWFIRLSLFYFLMGSLLGLFFIINPAMADTDHISMHVHLNLIGWMSMMIFGVGYHILPKFSGRPIWSRRLQTSQFLTANVGLLGMAAGWGMRAHGHAGGSGLLLAFGTLMFVSILLFVVNMVMTIKGPE